MKNIYLLLFLLVTLYSNSQVRMTGTAITSSNSSAFIDASSNVTNNGTVGTGKGLVFPRVDLSTFTFVGSAGIANNYPSRFDGMIVYNTASSGTANSGLTSGTLSPGFWFYENKSSTTTGGTWKSLGGGGSTTIKGRVACMGTITQTISNINVTDTASIIVTYEDPAGDLIYITIKSRNVGSSFEVQFATPPPTSANINYIILP
jgi:hypothetical protein